MNAPSIAGPAAPPAPAAVAAASAPAPRPLYWSLRRELWEHRSLYIAPLAVAAVQLCGFLINLFRTPGGLRATMALEPVQRRAAVIELPYGLAAMLLILTGLLVGAFYCLDALHGERRDRSILFWKSLPVSDLTAVLAKAGIPLAVLPLLLFAVIVATQLVMLLLSTVALAGDGQAIAALWASMPLLARSLALLYALAAISLWLAPVYGWLLLVSGWARRAVLAWAVLPPLAVCLFEAMAFRSAHFALWLRYRLIGGFEQAFDPRHSKVMEPLAALAPRHFLSSPGLWTGLEFAVLFFVLAVRLRRHRGPL